jgi:hypothetical protein
LRLVIELQYLEGFWFLLEDFFFEDWYYFSKGLAIFINKKYLKAKRRIMETQI